MVKVRAVPAMRAIARRVAVVVGTFVLTATGVVASAAPASASTPRAQFWEHPGFQGDKLDKDAFGSEQNLPALGRDCVPFWCENNWDNVISSLSTTGGGQGPAWLEIFEDPGFNGRCLLIAPNQSVGHLGTLNRGLTFAETWNERISSFIVYSGLSAQPSSRCLRFPA